MPKKDDTEIWDRLDELDGAVRALNLVLVRHIFRCDWVLRGHAHGLVERIEEDIADIAAIPPNQNLRRALCHLAKQVQQTAEIIDSLPKRSGED
jgi:hypothetical protein